MLDASGEMAFTWERVATKIAFSILKIQLFEFKGGDTLRTIIC